jgi:hypothetical protein
MNLKTSCRFLSSFLWPVLGGWFSGAVCGPVREINPWQIASVVIVLLSFFFLNLSGWSVW